MRTFLLLLSFGSGVAALIYEVVWFQLLELAIGSTAFALSLLLAAFMGGLCLGCFMPQFLVLARRWPLRFYAVLEIGIGTCGVLLLFAIPVVPGGAVAAGCLLLPTLLMGATLPTLARQAAGQPYAVSAIGLLYCANIAGAVFGSLLSGFYLLRVYDVATASYLAAGLNLLLGASAAAISMVAGAPDYEPCAAAQIPTPSGSGQRDWAIYCAIALSGLCALAAETVWTRLLTLLFGASVYAFSLVLAVFLTGLAAGCGLGSLLCRILPRPRIALGWCQLLEAGAIAWTAYNLAAALPYWPVNPAISTNIRYTFQIDLARAFWSLLPATLLWGASFPLALGSLVGLQEDKGGLTARVYAANTCGAIVGALCAGLLLVPLAGSGRAQQVLIAVSIFAGFLLLRPMKPRWLEAVSASAAVLAGAALATAVPLTPSLLLAYGRYGASWAGKSDIVYAREGMNASVAVADFASGARTFHVAGKIQASDVARDMRLQRMLGHLTTLTVAHPSSVLVIGCGAGITAGAVSIDPRVGREVIVEIERLVPEAAGTYFRGPNFDVLHNPKVTLRIGDGRHYLMTARERFDGITVDPLDPWVKGAANLYTEEFFQAMKQHLAPGGAVTVYIQLFETNLPAVKTSLATFFKVFPNGTVWGNPYKGQGHDVVLLGQVDPLRIDLDEMEMRFGYRSADSAIPASLAEVGIHSPVDLFATYVGRASDLAAWLRGVPINRDRNLRMQYLAGLGLNLDEAAGIYAGILVFRRFPEDLFAGSTGRMDSLRRAIGLPR